MERKRARDEFLRDVAQRDGVAGGGGGLRDAVAHRARAEDGDALDRDDRRVRMITDFAVRGSVQ